MYTISCTQPLRHYGHIFFSIFQNETTEPPLQPLHDSRLSHVVSPSFATPATLHVSISTQPLFMSVTQQTDRQPVEGKTSPNLTACLGRLKTTFPNCTHHKSRKNPQDKLACNYITCQLYTTPSDEDILYRDW